MMPSWAMLDERERTVFRATVAFLKGRLEERGTIAWALSLRPTDRAQRLAVLDILDRKDGRKISEPWQSAWGMIEEFWRNPIREEGPTSVAEYTLKSRIKAGDRSGALVAAIVNTVAPRIKVEPFSDVHLRYHKLPKRPKAVSDLFSVRLEGGKLLNLKVLMIADIEEADFLVSLAFSLDAAITKGLDISSRISTNKEYSHWHFGGLYRAYYVTSAAEEDDPDEFHHGIAPAVKLLHAVLSKLISLDAQLTKSFLDRLRTTGSPIHHRLWAALAVDSRVTSAEEVGDFLCGLNAHQFWDLHDYPEIAELRARRFPELSQAFQLQLLARLKKGPPRSQFKWGADAAQITQIQLYWALRELRRIELAGTEIPEKYRNWMKSHLASFPEIEQMKSLDEGFLEGTKIYGVKSNPDSKYDVLKGRARLRTLEEDLQSDSGHWENNPSRRASAWMQVAGNCSLVIDDMESAPEGGSAYPHVWEALGRDHTPKFHPENEANQEANEIDCSRVLDLLSNLNIKTVRHAIDGISQWLSSWQRILVLQPQAFSVWLKVWPIAVEATNTEHPSHKNEELALVLEHDQSRGSAELDTLNNPAGKLVGVFLAACPAVKPGEAPFFASSPIVLMLKEIEAVLGRSGSIVKYRLIEHLPYFLAASREWALSHLVPPLLDRSDDAVLFWSAVARQKLSLEVMEVLGPSIVERTTDLRLDRDTRKSLVFRVVIDCLYAYKDNREPAVNRPRVQQMLRSVDDEVRAHAAEAVQRFVKDLSAQDKVVGPSSAELFKAAAAPFLEQVWPQERSLASPGVSKAFSDLPATAKGSFAEAVSAIERFLVPFDCWSMLDYGLYGADEEEPRLLAINDAKKATAFLKLLDLTIGTSERAVVPYDLAIALQRIRSIAPSLEVKQSFRRLATAARKS